MLLIKCCFFSSLLVVTTKRFPMMTLFRTIFSFCSMLAMLPILCNVREVCAMLVWHLQQPIIIKKLTSPKYKLPKSDVVQARLHRFFLCNDVWTSPEQHCAGFLPVQCFSRSIIAKLK